jgi:ABC-type proline/glycine betaine transport system ATPase subunit
MKIQRRSRGPLGDSPFRLRPSIPLAAATGSENGGMVDTGDEPVFVQQTAPDAVEHLVANVDDIAAVEADRVMMQIMRQERETSPAITEIGFGHDSEISEHFESTVDSRNVQVRVANARICMDIVGSNVIPVGHKQLNEQDTLWRDPLSGITQASDHVRHGILHV